MIIVKCLFLYLSALKAQGLFQMTILEQISNPYLAFLVLGSSYGLAWRTSIREGRGMIAIVLKILQETIVIADKSIIQIENRLKS